MKAYPKCPVKSRIAKAPGHSKLVKSAQQMQTCVADSVDVDRIRLLEKDIEILSRKLGDLRKVQPALQHPECTTLTTSSSYANTIRSNIESGRALYNASEFKSKLIDKVLDRVAEIDREVLKQTSEGFPTNYRRNSRSGTINADLHSLPTHLALVDRLMDFHVLLKREQMTVTKPAGNCEEKSVLERYMSENSKLKVQLDELGNKSQKIVSCNESLEIENNDLKQQLKDSELANEVLLNELNAYKQIATDAEVKHNPDDLEKIDSLSMQVKELELVCKSLKERVDYAVSCVESATKSIGLGDSTHSPNSTAETNQVDVALHNLFNAIQTLKTQHSGTVRSVTDLNERINTLSSTHQHEIRVKEKVIGDLREKLDSQCTDIGIITTNLQETERRVNEYERVLSDHEGCEERVKRLEVKLEDAEKQVEFYKNIERTLISQVTELQNAFLDADDKREELAGLVRVLSKENNHAAEVNAGLNTRIADLPSLLQS